MIQKHFSSIRNFRAIAVLLFILLFSSQLSAQITIGSDLNDIDYLKPQKYTIGGITISGTQHLDKNVLIMLSNLNVGDEITVPGDKITDAIKKLWKQSLFENIKIVATKVEKNNIFLEIQLVERPRLSGYTFNGVKKGEADKLKEILGLVRGDVVTDNLRVSSTSKILNHFHEKGFLNADVTVNQVKDTTKINHVKLIFDIEKNRRIKIKEIHIIGNENLSDVTIKRALKNTKEKARFRPLNSLHELIYQTGVNLFHLNFRGAMDSAQNILAEDYNLRIFKRSKYLENEFDEDKVNLIKKYNKHGFRDFKILDESITINDDKTIDLNIKVDEGNRYYFRDINWIGNTIYSADKLNERLGIQKGDVFNKEILDTKLNMDPNGMDVSSLYLDNGYLFFQAFPIEKNIDHDSIDLELRLYEGEQARIKNVTISGNTKTKDYVVIRELYTKPGELFSKTDIIRSIRELAQLKYFNQETIQPIPKPNPQNNTVDIEYKVEEASTDQVELSGGWGYGRVIGTLGLSFNNFSAKNFFKRSAWTPVPTGDGQKINLRLQSYGKGYISFSTSFTEPWLGGKKPTSLTVSYYTSVMGNSFLSSDFDWSIIINSVNVAIGKRLKWPDDFFILRQSIGFQRYKLENYRRILLGDGNGQYNTISYNIMLGRNSVDAPIYPRSGSDISLSLEVTPPYSAFTNKNYKSMSDQEKFKWMEFHKWKFRGSWYKQLAGDLVLSLRTRYGFLNAYNDDIGITPFNRFFLGGDGLSGGGGYFDGREIIAMRGYENLSLTPNFYAQDNLGGTIYNKNTLELRYLISPNPSATIYALSFLEAGNAWTDFSGFQPFKLYKSAGVGIRIYLPIFGLLGLDWGYGFDKVPGLPKANRGHFAFSINQSID